MAPSLTVVPGGGLCNRMAMLDSALALGRRLGRSVDVVWKLGRALNCRLEDLFEPLPGVARVAHVRANTLPGKVSLKVRQAWASLRGADTWYRHELYGMREDPAALLERARKATRLRIRGDTRFYADGPLYQGFQPVPALAARIRAEAAGLEGAVGVHVRRTDHAEAIRRSPLDAFVAALREERAEAPGCPIFVATDDPTVRDALRTALGGEIRHTTPRSLDRNTPEAIEDALVDLYCLASCRRLVTGPLTTFGQTAWQLRGIPHRMVDIRT